MATLVKILEYAALRDLWKSVQILLVLRMWEEGIGYTKVPRDVCTSNRRKKECQGYSSSWGRRKI